MRWEVERQTPAVSSPFPQNQSKQMYSRVFYELVSLVLCFNWSKFALYHQDGDNPRPPPIKPQHGGSGSVTALPPSRVHWAGREEEGLGSDHWMRPRRITKTESTGSMWNQIPKRSQGQGQSTSKHNL